MHAGHSSCKILPTCGSTDPHIHVDLELPKLKFNFNSLNFTHSLTSWSVLSIYLQSKLQLVCILIYLTTTFNISLLLKELLESSCITVITRF